MDLSGIPGFTGGLASTTPEAEFTHRQFHSLGQDSMMLSSLPGNVMSCCLEH